MKYILATGERKHCIKIDDSMLTDLVDYLHDEGYKVEKCYAWLWKLYCKMDSVEEHDSFTLELIEDLELDDDRMAVWIDDQPDLNEFINLDCTPSMVFKEA